ncbi:hypothetical protein GCM10027261_37790 [Geodermatophilus arenarius]|uniref:DUF2188 domain-containing protein n=1 Tax=Geodermatophilus arenarius TaxID=1137990 RepID=A0ABV9LPG5_9ACTN
MTDRRPTDQRPTDQRPTDQRPTDPRPLPGHGPADPDGYLVEETPGGYRWTCRSDGRTGGPFPTREEAVASAEADRTP